jgi:hypothetical protein
MSSQVDRRTLEEHYLHTDPSDDRSGSSAAVDRAMKSCLKERKCCDFFPLHTYIHTCRNTAKLAYIHAHPWRIVGIDTIRCAAVGHRGTGGGGGEEQGGIVGEEEEIIRRETLCTSAGRDMCMYVSMCIRYDVWGAAYVYLYLLHHLHCP